MSRRTSVALLGSFAVLLAGVPASGHHSFGAVYDMTNEVTVRGVIVEVRLTNPHSWFFLEVTNEEGETEQWGFEAGTPSGMIRNGFKRDVIQAGAEVTIRGFHARDLSQTMGMLSELVTEDGTVYGMFGPQEGPGAQ